MLKFQMRLLDGAVRLVCPASECLYFINDRAICSLAEANACVIDCSPSGPLSESGPRIATLDAIRFASDSKTIL